VSIYFRVVITEVPCDQIKKNRVGENDGLNQLKHQNSTILVTRFFLIDRTLLLPTKTLDGHSQLGPKNIVNA
jgi:hypothetical protein